MKKMMMTMKQSTKNNNYHSYEVKGMKTLESSKHFVSLFTWTDCFSLRFLARYHFMISFPGNDHYTNIRCIDIIENQLKDKTFVLLRFVLHIESFQKTQTFDFNSLF